MPTYLSDEEMFGAGKTAPTYLSDEEMFGAPAEAPKKKKPASSGIYNNAEALVGAIDKGVGGILQSGGEFIQAPIANTAAGFYGAGALLDTGITRLTKAFDPNSGVQENPETQKAAQDASRAAMEQRASNSNMDAPGSWLNPAKVIAKAGLTLSQAEREHTQEVNARLAASGSGVLEGQKNIGDASGFVDTSLAVLSNPLGTAGYIAESLPGMLMGVGFSSVVARSITAGAETAAAAAANRIAAAGGDAVAQRAAADAVMQAAANKAVSRASATGVAAETVQSAGQGREGVYQQVTAIPTEKLNAQSPRYREILAEVNDPIKAREILANESADRTVGVTAAGTAAGSLLLNKAFGGDTTAEIAAGVRTKARDIPKNFAHEGTEEVLQGIPETYAEHGAMLAADPNHQVDLGGSIAQNFMVGGVMGGSGATASMLKQAAFGSLDKPGSTPPPAAKPVAQGGAPINASEVLGPSSIKGGSDIVGTTDTSAADKALLTPIGSNDLDRVTELTKQIADSTDATEIATLTQERHDLTKNWPTAIPGNAASFSTESGSRLEGQYALIDADQLVTSHDENLRANPAYPSELQPRERERAASEMQVSGIVQKLDPARLGLSADSATGAPIVGADGLVESGNARTIALKRIYQANGQKAIDYKQFLADNAAQFGITPESVQGMAKPVLVRIRSTPVNRAEFARQANAPTVAQMSPSEQAKSDSKRITSMDDLNPDDNGDFGTSRDFIRRFLAQLPQTEQGAMIDADGKLSTAGYSRISNAILAKAYGDSPVLTRMVESRDDNLRNVSKALLLAAPTVAKMRQAISQGSRFDADITPDLMAAVEELSSLKDSGTSLQDALAQAGMFGEKYSAETKQLLQFLADNIRRPRRMAEFITNYMDALDAAGDPNQDSLFGDVQAPAKSELLNAVQKGLDQNGTQDLRADTTKDTERGQPGESAPTGSADRGQPTDAPGNRGGNEGDGATGSSGQAQSVEKSEWVNFPKDSGTIGIPRADMPQIKGDHRGALLQFLKARGIDNETKENVPASEFKPTQAEFSIKKTANWAEIRDGSDRSVLVSSDGYILDGHHQWMAAVSANEPVKAIVLDSPIRELLTAVFQFPSVQQSQDSAKTDDKRTKARDDFKAAMADLADLMADKLGARAMFIKPGDADLQKILSRLFSAAIEAVGTDLKAATKWVKDKLKSDPETKSWWNKITDKDYQTAALTALESGAKQKVDDLFAKAEKAQSSLFDNAPAAPKVAMIKGLAYDYAEKTGDNFKIPAPSSFLSAEVIAAADAFVKKYYTNAEHPMTQEERAKAEKLMAPYVAKAQEAKAGYDQKIIDIAQRTKALGQLLAPIKSLKRGAEKMWDDSQQDGLPMNPAKIRDFLRSTIVVSSFADAQNVIDAIGAQFKVIQIKDKTSPQAREASGGYSDYALFVETGDGVMAEIQISVPAMLSAKENQGHKLYEAARSLPSANPLKAEIYASMRGLYDAAFDALTGGILPVSANALDDAAQLTKVSSDSGAPVRGPASSMPGKGMSDAPSSDILNQPSPGILTKSSEKLVTKSQPAGKDDGNFINNSLDQNITDPTKKGYEKSDSSKKSDVKAQQDKKSAATKIDDLGEKIGGARKDKAEKGTSRKTAKAKDDRPTWAKRFDVMEIVAGDNVGRWTIHDNKLKDFLGNPKQVGGRNNHFPSEQAALDAIPLAAVSMKHRVAPSGMKGENGEYTYEIWRDINDRKRVKVVNQTFNTRLEALEYMAKNAVAILETNTTFGEADLPRPDNTGRTGVERREGDVDGSDFMSTFGFRGVEFGNWNNQAERQEVMNAAFDGLLDLAQVMEIPAAAISFNGDLALAFGARGQGLSSAVAHYEMGRAVINLTKMNGAGALAHEWFHALDHYLGRLDGKASSQWKVESDGTKTFTSKGAENDMVSSGFSYRNSGVRPELRQAYETIINTMFKKAEKYVEDTSKADMFVARSKEDVAKILDGLRKDLSEQKDVRYYKRNNKPASAEQLVEFDTVAKQIMDGQAFAIGFFQVATSKNAYGGRMSNAAVEQLSAIYKTVRGRSGFGNDKYRGVMDDLRAAMMRYTERLKMLAEAQNQTEKVKGVPTAFAMDAKELDQGRGENYWTTPHEMAARAFQGYVEDKIAAQGAKSPFLNYAPENAAILTPWGAKRPFPHGEERKVINATFDKFVEVLETKQTDKGIAVFENTPGYGALSVTKTERISDPLEGIKTKITLSNGKNFSVVKLNSAESMGLPGWHDVDGGYLADTKDEAIKRILQREGEKELTVAQFVNENTGEYETDLFGNPLPEQTKRPSATRSTGSTVRRDIRPAASVSDTEAPEGQYFARTTIGSEVSRKMGTDKVLNSGDLASATSYLYKSAVERLDGVVTDKNGKILGVVGGFKGALTQSAVYPATIMAEAIRIPGAANIWFSHNHPSGKPNLSRADSNLYDVLANVFNGTGIEPMGIIAVGNGQYAGTGPGKGLEGGGNFTQDIPKAKGEFAVPVMERMLEPPSQAPGEPIATPDRAKAYAIEAFKQSGGHPGLIILNAQMQPTGWLPIGGLLSGKLRGTGGMNALFRAVSESNMGNAIMVHGGELDGFVDRDYRISIGQNIGAALALVDVQVLDSLKVTSTSLSDGSRGFIASSAAQLGSGLASGPVLSRRRGNGNALPDAIVANKLGELSKNPDYVAAKAGDVKAAVRIASELVDTKLVNSVVAAAGSSPIIVPVISLEATGRNKIPKAAAEVLASKIGAEVSAGIVQLNSPKRTSMDGLSRLLSPPEFDGPVVPGRSYVLVDDTITQGGTFAALASHILAGGGKISAVVALTGKQYSAKIAPSIDLLTKVYERFGNVEQQFRAATGYGFDALTESELRYLEKHDDAKSVRDRIVAAGRNRSNQANSSDPSLSDKLSRDGNQSMPKTGMDYQELVTLVDGIKAKMPNMPKVHVLADPGTAPKALKDYITKQGAWNDVEGAFHNGELYMFANGLSDPLRAEHVLAEHEAAHYGLRAVLGNDVAKVMQMLYNNNPRLRKAAAELQALGDLTIAEAVEEVIVDIPSAELAKLSGWRKLVTKVRDYLQERGYTNLAAEITRFLNSTLGSQQRADLMVADLVRLARGFVAGNTPFMQTPNMQASRLASSLADDAAKQEKWLTKEAKARGYQDIDTLAEKDYPLFEKLAKMWREANPAENGVLLSRGSGGDQTQTPAFKKWFGDSKTVDADGKPMVLYHGTDSEDLFNEFDTMDFGSWFAESRKTAEVYEAKNGDIEKSRIYSVYLKAEKPFYISRDFDMSDDHRVQDLLDAVNADNGTDITAKEIAFDPDYTATAAHYIGLNDRFIDAVKKAGFDSINGYELGDSTWNVFESTQVKSATNNNGDFDGTNPDIRLSRTQGQAAPAKDVADRAEAIIQKSGATIRPMDAAAYALTRVTGVEKMTTFAYDSAAKILDRIVPEAVKAGVISDYGVPQAVLDRRATMQGNQRKELTKVGSLLEKLATLTRAESRVAYEWMNMDGSDPQAYMSMMQGLPEESVKVLTEVQKMIDELSQEAMRLGQLSPEAYKRNRMAYLRRSYVKHTAELTKGEAGKKARAISILGDQYKGRGMVDSVAMEKVQKDSTDWWKSKLQAGKADAALKGERFVRLERRAPSGEGTKSIDGMESKKPGKLLETAYIAVSEPIPAKYKEWSRAGVWEVRDVKGPNLVMWRDFTKDEREKMGEIDEARYSIAKTLHGMIHDVEVGRYLEWLGQTYGKLDGDAIPGTVVEASERMRDSFKPDEWVQVPTTKIAGTQVAKYGSLAGKYIPGPIWNDLRQVVSGQFKPFGESYATLLSMWKTSKTALSIGVHTNNIMSNFVMADWHDVSAGHISKALKIILAASRNTDRKGVGGMVLRTGSKIGIADAEAAREIMNRYRDSGGDIGSWVTSEIKSEQLAPLLESLEKELALTAGSSMSAQIGIMGALQHVMKLQFPAAFEALKMGKRSGAVVNAVKTEGNNLIDLYQSEDDVFRLAKWLSEKEQGKTDLEAGKSARVSFLDYRVNAPWIQAMRTTAWPFVSFSYRAIPMFAEIAAKKPHKLMKLMLLAGAVNAFGVMLAGGGDDDEKERKLLPEEKAGGIWGMVPKLIRMPWNDDHNSPVYLDIRRFIPVGDFLDLGQSHSAVPLFPFLQPGGPLMLAGELVLNKSQFTGKAIVNETDTFGQGLGKTLDYLYKAFAPNLLGVPGTYATTGVMDAMKGRTDAFGREMSVPQAVMSSFGVKVGSYPADVMRKNLQGQAQAQLMEIDKTIMGLKRQRQTNRISEQEYRDSVTFEQEKKVKLIEKLREKL